MSSTMHDSDSRARRALPRETDCSSVLDLTAVAYHKDSFRDTPVKRVCTKEE